MPEPALLTSRPRVLSGMRPTGKLHLGNYMGALANWVKLQDSGQYECYFFIADWHALTTDYADPSRIKRSTVDVALDWLAAGLDDKSTIFVQSHVPQHAELHLLFSMITPLSWLERVPTYKEQQENLKSKDLSTYGFLGYPLLQAADILLYQPQFVPVGQDQVAHVELTREVARRFNSMYRSQMLGRLSVFPEPEALLTPSPKLPGTDGRKMSKSYGNTIELTDDPKSILQKIETMSTNGQRPRHIDPGDPDLCPVGDLHKVFSPIEIVAEIQGACRDASIGCRECKAKVAASISAHLEPIYERRQRLTEADAWNALSKGAKHARTIAHQVLLLAKDVVGLARSEEDAGIFRETTALPHLRNPGANDLGTEIRNAWLTNQVRDISLKEADSGKFETPERFLEEPILTSKGKRVFAIAAWDGNEGDQPWTFEVPLRSYEVWALLCLNVGNGELHDFIVPQKYFNFQFSQAKKALAKDQKIPIRIMLEHGRFHLAIGNGNFQNITELKGNYDPFQ